MTIVNAVPMFIICPDILVNIPVFYGRDLKIKKPFILQRLNCSTTDYVVFIILILYRYNLGYLIVIYVYIYIYIYGC